MSDLSNGEGWGWPLNSRKAHYFSESRSLCGRWLYAGRSLGDQTSKPSPDDCKACAQRLAQMYSVEEPTSPGQGRPRGLARGAVDARDGGEQGIPQAIRDDPEEGGGKTPERKGAMTQKTRRAFVESLMRDYNFSRPDAERAADLAESFGLRFELEPVVIHYPLHALPMSSVVDNKGRVILGPASSPERDRVRRAIVDAANRAFAAGLLGEAEGLEEGG